MNMRIVLMDDYAGAARGLDCTHRLAQRARLQIFTTPAASRDELIDRLHMADVVIAVRDRVAFSRGVLARAKSLRLVAVCGVRIPGNIDLEAARELGIEVCAGRPSDSDGTVQHATAEMAIALLFGLARNLVAHARTVATGGWQEQGSGQTLRGRTLGLVGLGDIGTLVARIGCALGMRVLAFSPRLDDARAGSAGATRVDFDELLRRSDFVSLHATLNERTRGLLGAREFASMRDGAFLINTARAALVDELALREALQCGKLAGAGLDVFWDEPLPPGHWARTEPRLLAHPHLGGFTGEGFERLLAPAVDNVMAWLDGSPLPGVHYPARVSGP